MMDSDPTAESPPPSATSSCEESSGSGIVVDTIDEHPPIQTSHIPPPPPHIELLNISSHGHCITHVISYLTRDDRRAARASCKCLRDAVTILKNATALAAGIKASVMEDFVAMKRSVFGVGSCSWIINDLEQHGGKVGDGTAIPGALMESRDEMKLLASSANGLGTRDEEERNLAEKQVEMNMKPVATLAKVVSDREGVMMMGEEVCVAINDQNITLKETNDSDEDILPNPVPMDDKKKQEEQYVKSLDDEWSLFKEEDSIPNCKRSICNYSDTMFLSMVHQESSSQAPSLPNCRVVVADDTSTSGLISALTLETTDTVGCAWNTSEQDGGQDVKEDDEENEGENHEHSDEDAPVTKLQKGGSPRSAMDLYRRSVTTATCSTVMVDNAGRSRNGDKADSDFADSIFEGTSVGSVRDEVAKVVVSKNELQSQQQHKEQEVQTKCEQQEEQLDHHEHGAKPFYKASFISSAGINSRTIAPPKSNSDVSIYSTVTLGSSITDIPDDSAHEDGQVQQEVKQELSYIRLSDLRFASREEIPFDEVRPAPLVSQDESTKSTYDDDNEDDALSQVSSSYLLNNDYDNDYNNDNESDYSSSSDEETAPDVLAQLSDAALFGDTQVLTDIMTEMMNSAKHAASLFTANDSSEGLPSSERKRRSYLGIDDDGPIKIGEKLYSHNQALKLWRKSKVKLEDQYHQVDGNGDVKMERASFFEKNSVFQEVTQSPGETQEKKPKKVSFGRNSVFQFKNESNNEKDVSSSNNERGTDNDNNQHEKEVPVNKLVSKISIFKRKETNGKKISRFVASGDLVDNNNKGEENICVTILEDSTPTLPPASSPDDEDENAKADTDITNVTGDKAGNETAHTDGPTRDVVGADMGIHDIFDTSETTSISDDASNSWIESSSDNCDEIIGNSGVVNSQNHENDLRPETGSFENEKPRANDTVEPTPAASIQKKVFSENNETNSVAGMDSLPSHMGSMYGVEVTSLRGSSCNFVNGKTSEKIKLMGGRSVKSIKSKYSGEQSVLGSQYGTRKPRTLASHNMGVKKNVSVNRVSTVGKHQSNGRGDGVKGTVEQERQSSGSKGSTKPPPEPAKGMKLKVKKPNLSLKLKLGKKKSVARS